LRKRGVLRDHPYFCSLSPNQLAAVQEQIVVRQYRPGVVIRLRGEPCEGLYLIASGSVRLIRSSPRGREQVLHHLVSGQSFGGVSALDGSAMMATANAAEDTTIFLLPRTEFLRLLNRVPGIAVAVMQVWASRLRELSDLAADLALSPVMARVAGAILHLSGGKSSVRLPPREKLASITGTVREVAARALGDLERMGALRRRGSDHVAILDREALLRIYEQIPYVPTRKIHRTH
jgi:CRP-like cAMP-binding protein